MDFKASHRYAKTTARKARLVVDLIRGLPVNRALTVLDRSPRRAAVLVGRVVRSAVANAEQKGDVDPNLLNVAEARVDEGPLLGGFLRWRPGPRGRAMPIHKRTAHIHIALAPPKSALAAATGAGAAAEAPAAGGTGKAGKAAGSGKQRAGGASGGKAGKAGKAGGQAADRKASGSSGGRSGARRKTKGD